MGDVIERRGKRGLHYYIRFEDTDGKRKCRAAKMPDGTEPRTKREATTLLRDAEAKVRKGEQVVRAKLDEAEKRQLTVTVRDLAKRFGQEARPANRAHKPTLRSLKAYRCSLRSLLKQHALDLIGDMPAAAVDSLAVEKLRDQVLDAGFALDTAGRTLTALSQLYVWARRERLIACVNPCAGVQRPKSAMASADYLSAEECGKFIAWLGQNATAQLHTMAVLALTSGMRKGEMFGLTWKRVDFEAKRIDVEASYDGPTKTGEKRSLEMHADALPLLKVWRQFCPPTPLDLVFPVSGGKGKWRLGNSLDMLHINRALQKSIGRMFDRPWHLLRHTFASHLAMAGVSLYALQRMLGHSDPKMTMRYSKLSPDFMAQEVARLSFPVPKPDATVTSIDVARAYREMDRTSDTDVTVPAEPAANAGK